MSRRTIDPPLAALIRALKPALGAFRVVESDSQAWASATFAGGRHVLTLELEGDDGDARASALCVTIATLEFDLPRLLVADIVAQAAGAQLRIEALILDEC